MPPRVALSRQLHHALRTGGHCAAAVTSAAGALPSGRGLRRASVSGPTARRPAPPAGTTRGRLIGLAFSGRGVRRLGRSDQRRRFTRQGSNRAVTRADRCGRGADLGRARQSLEVAPLLGQHERDHVAVIAGARGASGTVQIRLVLGRRVNVHHQVDIVHVNAAGGDVGGHHHGDLTVGERLEAPLARILGQVAVQLDGGDAVRGQVASELAGLVLGAQEQQPTAGASGQLADDLPLLSGIADQEHVVGEGCDRRGLGVDAVHQRTAQEPLHQGVDTTVEGRREQQALSARRGAGQNAGDGGEKAEIGHVVGLVQHGDRDRVQPDVGLTDQVFEAAGCGHHDVGAAPQLGDLLGLADSAEDGHRLQARGLGQRFERGQNLIGQLAGGSQDQRSRRARTGALRDRPGGRHQARQPRHQGQGEGQRLAGAGAAAAEHISSGQCVGQGGRLNRERGFDALIAQGGDQGGGDAERGKGGLGQDGLRQSTALLDEGHHDPGSTREPGR